MEEFAHGSLHDIGAMLFAAVKQHRVFAVKGVLASRCRSLCLSVLICKAMGLMGKGCSGN